MSRLRLAVSRGDLRRGDWRGGEEELGLRAFVFAWQVELESGAFSLQRTVVPFCGGRVGEKMKKGHLCERCPFFSFNKEMK
jgi:hypothetical protein